MKGRFKIVQTWWLCERRISSMRASTQNHNRKRVHHCSWEAMQMTSSSRDITVMWSIGTKNRSCSWTQHQLQHQLAFLIARKALPNLVIIVCCMAVVIWGDRTSLFHSCLCSSRFFGFWTKRRRTTTENERTRTKSDVVSRLHHQCDASRTTEWWVDENEDSGIRLVRSFVRSSFVRWLQRLCSGNGGFVCTVVLEEETGKVA